MTVEQLEMGMQIKSVLENLEKIKEKVECLTQCFHSEVGEISIEITNSIDNDSKVNIIDSTFIEEILISYLNLLADKISDLKSAFENV